MENSENQPPVITRPKAVHFPRRLDVLICLVGAAYASNLTFQHADWTNSAYASGELVGCFLGVLIFSLIPAWLVWRFSRKALAARIVCYLILGLGLLGEYSQPGKTTTINQEFANNAMRAAKEQLKNIESGNIQAGNQPMIAALEKEAASKSPDAAAAEVAAQFSREIQQNENEFVEVITNAGKVPMPDGIDVKAYDLKIASDNNVLEAVAKHSAYLKNSPARITEIVRSKNQPGLEKNQFLLGFSEGANGALPLVLQLDTNVGKLFLSQRDIVELLKANHSHWHPGADRKVVLDDPAEQKKYDAFLTTNTQAGDEITQIQERLIALQKKNVEAAKGP